MRSIFHTILLAGLFLGLGSGCKDFLNVPSDDNLSRSDLFSSVRGANAAVAGLYYQLGDPSYYQFRMPVYADLPGNGHPLAEGTGSEGQFVGIQLGLVSLHNRELAPDLEDTGMPALYEEAYSLLFQANDVIEAVPELTDGAPEQLASLVAEAQVIRALVHFDLVRLFAQAPGFSANAAHPGIILMNGTPGIFDFPARVSVAEVYALIVADLEAAAADLDATFSQRTGANHWLTPAIVNGLLARVHSYTGNWEACREQANECLAASGRDLTPTTSYLDGWKNGNLSETLWSLDLQRLVEEEEDDDTIQQTPARIFGTGNPEPFLEVSSDLADLFTLNDLRQELLARNDDGSLLSAKWPFDTNQVSNIPMLRLSEVYLLRAEANLETGRLAEASADYLAVHQRAVETGPPPPTDAMGLRQAIRDERRRELAFEGHHFFDLGRWGDDLIRTDCAQVVTDCELRYPDPRFILPIPLDALLNNPNLTQNPGY
jgi:hypothetical protein